MAGSTMRPSSPMFSASRAKRHARAVVYSATPVSMGMRQGFALIGLVDHGRQHHEAVESDVFRIAGKAARQGGSVFRHAGEHGNAAVDHLLHFPQGLLLRSEE